LLEQSVKHNVKKFVYVSSSMVYGNFNRHAMSDGINENNDCKPMGQYGIMKLTGEWLVQDYSRQHKLDYTIVRPSAVYGPYDVEDRVISKFLTQAMQGKELTVNGIDDALDFTYVDDAAMGIALSAISEDTKNTTYNIARGKSHTLMTAATLIVDMVGKGSVTIKNRDTSFPIRGQLNINRAKLDFGYYPTVDLVDGLKEYYNWLQYD